MQLNNCKLYILPSVYLKWKNWVQMPLNTSHVGSVKWRSWVYWLQLVICPKYLHPYNCHTITQVRTGEQDIICLPKEEKKKKRSASRGRLVVTSCRLGWMAHVSRRGEANHTEFSYRLTHCICNKVLIHWFATKY